MIVDPLIGQSRHGGGRPSFLADFSDRYPDPSTYMNRSQTENESDSQLSSPFE